MKKASIILFAAAALAFTSCDDKSDLGVMQVNPQLEAMTADGVTAALSDALKAQVNLDANVGKTIPVISVTEAQNLPEGATVEFKMFVSPNEDYSNATELAVADGAVSADEWEQAFTDYFNVDPTARDMYVRFAGYVLDGNQLSRLGGNDFWYLPTKVSVLPVDARLDVENAYYLSLNGAAPAASTAFEHSASHPYVDPNFTVVFEVTEGSATWMVVPESQHSAASLAECYGVAETGAPDAWSGSLVKGGAAGQINGNGTYMLKVNMLDKTYTLSYAFEYLYTPGNANGWGFGADNMRLFTDNYGDYHGFVYVDGEFKLSADVNWANNWGLDNGVLTPGGSNIRVDENGLYYVNANLMSLTLGVTHITGVGCIGDFNDWGADAALAPANDQATVWTGDVDFTKAGGWKFRMNGGWDINLGGTEGNLVPNGDNMNIAEPGVYTVTLDLTTLPYTCTVVKK